MFEILLSTTQRMQWIICCVLSVCMHTSIAVRQCVAPPSGLISWWPADGDANDIHGANSGVSINGASYDIGKVGQAFSFDGINDHVVILDSNSLDFGVGDYSVEAWVKTSFLGGVGSDFIFSKMSSGRDQQFVLSYRAKDSGFPRFQMGDGIDTVFADGGFSIADGQWHHIAACAQGLL